MPCFLEGCILHPPPRLYLRLLVALSWKPLLQAFPSFASIHLAEHNPTCNHHLVHIELPAHWMIVPTFWSCASKSLVCLSKASTSCLKTDASCGTHPPQANKKLYKPSTMYRMQDFPVLTAFPKVQISFSTILSCLSRLAIPSHEGGNT